MYDTITNTLACIVRAFEDIEFIVFLVVSALLGIHLIEPYLSLTYYYPLKYEDLVKMSRELYDDLQGTDPTQLLSVDQFAFSFAHTRLELTDVIKWDSAV